MNKLVFFLLFICWGCSKLEKSTASNQKQFILKKQYDELLQKYQALIKQKRDPKNSTSTHLSNIKKRSPNFAETVDIFANNTSNISKTKKDKQGQRLAPIQHSTSSTNIEKDIQKIRQGIKLIEQKQYVQALAILRPLSLSKTRQIRVRAKFYTGEALFGQKQYDLAMQVFEDILSKDSFSGLVLQTLRKLVACSKELKIQKKQDTYYSMLHDFFET